MDKCNFSTCRFNENGKCTDEKSRKQCVEVAEKVLCLDEPFYVSVNTKSVNETLEYIEKDYECDVCEHRAECEKRGYLLDVSTYRDVRSHFIRGLGSRCIKRGIE